MYHRGKNLLAVFCPHQDEGTGGRLGAGEVVGGGGEGGGGLIFFNSCYARKPMVEM